MVLGEESLTPEGEGREWAGKAETAEGTNHKGSHAGKGKEGNVSRATHISDKRASRKVITENSGPGYLRVSLEISKSLGII